MSPVRYNRSLLPSEELYRQVCFTTHLEIELMLSTSNDNVARAERIRSLRLSLGLTRQQVADELGWHQASRVSVYEFGHRPFSAKMEAKITAAIRRVAALKAADRG